MRVPRLERKVGKPALNCMSSSLLVFFASCLCVLPRQLHSKSRLYGFPPTQNEEDVYELIRLLPIDSRTSMVVPSALTSKR